MIRLRQNSSSELKQAIDQGTRDWPDRVTTDQYNKNISQFLINLDSVNLQDTVAFPLSYRSEYLITFLMCVLYYFIKYADELVVIGGRWANGPENGPRFYGISIRSPLEGLSICISSKG